MGSGAPKGTILVEICVEFAERREIAAITPNTTSAAKATLK